MGSELVLGRRMSRLNTREATVASLADGARGRWEGRSEGGGVDVAPAGGGRGVSGGLPARV